MSKLSESLKTHFEINFKVRLVYCRTSLDNIVDSMYCDKANFLSCTTDVAVLNVCTQINETEV